MKRREFITLLGSAASAWPFVARAQQARIPRVGVLWPGASPPPPPRMESFRQGLRASGLVEDRDVAIELRYAKDGPLQLPALAAELVGLNVGVMVAFGDQGPRIAQQATASTPIVAISDDMLGAGLIASLAKPGGNITGLSLLAPELSAKRVEFLKELVPGLSRVAVLWDPTTAASQVSMTEEVARSLNLKLEVLEIRRREDVAGVIRNARNSQTDGINVLSSPFLASLFREIIKSSAEYQIPATYQWREHADAGGLLSYGPSLAAMYRQLAGTVSRVLKGARPADLPVEHPTKFELAINLTTAKGLGLTVPYTLLARVDEIIE